MDRTNLGEEKSEGQAARLSAALRTIIALAVVIIVLMFYGVYEVLNGEQIQALSLTVLGAVALGMLVFIRKLLYRGENDRAALLTLFTVFGLIEGTLLFDPGSSWMIGPTVCLALSQITGQMMSRSQSVRGILLAVLAGGIITLNDTLLKPAFSITFTETTWIVLAVALTFSWNLARSYRTFSIGAKVMLAMSGAVTLTVVLVAGAGIFALQRSSEYQALLAANGTDEVARIMVISGGIAMIFGAPLQVDDRPDHLGAESRD